MDQVIEAIYEDGLLRPLHKLSLRPNQRVLLRIEEASDVQPTLDSVRGQATTPMANPPAGRPILTLRNGLPVMRVPPGTPAIDPVAVRRVLDEEPF
jgi:predicted DNA-binding antitoxin AbrB/MazE fold protein